MESCRLWSPVIYDQLIEPRRWSEELVYPVEKVSEKIEDLKVKLHGITVRRQGRWLEVNIRMEVLVLLQEARGQMRLLAMMEKKQERISLSEFSTLLKESGLELIADVAAITWDGELREGQIIIGIELVYQIMAAKYQALNVVLDTQRHKSTDPDEELLYELQSQIMRAEAVKIELKRKIHCYEKDIQSLKKGINRAEKRNLLLNEELSRHRRMVDQLSQYGPAGNPRHLTTENKDRESKPVMENGADENLSLGGFIKKLFQNNA